LFLRVSFQFLLFLFPSSYGLHVSKETVQRCSGGFQWCVIISHFMTFRSPARFAGCRPVRIWLWSSALWHHIVSLVIGHLLRGTQSHQCSTKLVITCGNMRCYNAEYRNHSFQLMKRDSGGTFGYILTSNVRNVHSV
jgi:hypothetical protein